MQNGAKDTSLLCKVLGDDWVKRLLELVRSSHFCGRLEKKFPRTYFVLLQKKIIQIQILKVLLFENHWHYRFLASFSYRNQNM